MRKIYLLPLIVALFSGVTLFASCEEEGLNPPADSLPDPPQESVCAHVFDVETISEPTCKEEGEKKLTCQKCGLEKTEKIAKIDHILSDREETLPAACESEGESAQICTMCGEKFFVETLPALGHSMKECSYSPATCLKEGERVLQCERCEKSEREVLPLADHDWEEVEELKKPTCIEEGLSSAVCKVCGKETDQRAIPALGHDLEETLREDATCEKDGKVERACTRCDHTETEVLPAFGHTFEDKILQQPTCTENGRAVPVCKTCKAQGEEKIINSLGHSFSNWEEVLRPTCVLDGREERTCSVCGKREEKKISQLGHHFSNDYIVDKQPTKQEEGEESRHCLNPGCNERRDIHKIDKLEDRTDYAVTLIRTSGERFTAGSPTIKILSERGEEITTLQGSYLSVNLPTENYFVTVEDLPQGFALAKGSYALTPQEPSIEIGVPASMIMEEAPLTTQYVIGDVIFDKEVDVVELEEENDHKIKLSDLLSTHKAILLNLYYSTCPYCIMEMPDFVRAYQAMTPDGKVYGDEVACLLLDFREMVDRVRTMKHQSNFYLQSYQGVQYEAVYDVPIMTIHDAWLTSFFSWKIAVSFPTTILIDSEGVIREKHAGYLGEEGFKNMMQKGIDLYNKTQEWKKREGLAEPAQKSIAPNVDLLKGESAICVEKKERYE